MTFSLGGGGNLPAENPQLPQNGAGQPTPPPLESSLISDTTELFEALLKKNRRSRAIKLDPQQEIDLSERIIQDFQNASY